MTFGFKMRAAILTVAVVWHLLSLFSTGWTTAKKTKRGGDFSTYYYALEVARDGGDPYENASLSQMALGRHRGVHPYFYPPPFLVAFSWISEEMSLVEAYRVWFWFDELAMLAVGLALAYWLRPLGSGRGLLSDSTIVVAIAIAGLTSVVNNHLMGQVNAPVLMLVVLGLWATNPLTGETRSTSRDVIGGALVGTAVMMKMSPVLFLFWWALKGRFRPIMAAVATIIALSIVSLPLVDLATQIRFYTEVFPGFATGEYNGLKVPIGLFGNHSMPNLLDMAFPSPNGVLSGTARGLSAAVLAIGLAGMAALFRYSSQKDDPFVVAGQISAVAVFMLLVPVYTYEHHLLWGLPAVVVSALAVLKGRLAIIWSLPLGFSWAVWAWNLASLKFWSQAAAKDGSDIAAFAIQELKFLSLLVLLVAAVILGSQSEKKGVRIGHKGGCEHVS